MLRHWGAKRPLAAVWSGGEPGEHSRWTVLAEPRETVSARGREASELVRRIGSPGASANSADGVPVFQGGWIGWLSYDLGRQYEGRACHEPGAVDDRAWSDVVMCRCDRALVLDRVRGEWWEVGERGWWEPSDGPEEAAEIVGEARIGAGEAYERGVSRVLEYIRAGDVYQVNLAHRMSVGVRGSGRAVWRELLRAAEPWYGGYVEGDTLRPGGVLREIVASASPEQFVTVDFEGRRIGTRPMKGTRRVGPGAESALRDCAKERAELAMIVDLMRNDLGRISDLGSVRVESPRRIERHAADVLQATATVGARLREGLGLEDLMAAAFPPGSVTGAPKIRAMQVIDELEPVRRGPYCGCLGFVSDSGHGAFNVAIRTAGIRGTPGPRGSGAITDGVMDYSVGAGIVAESDPGAEWRETLLKAGVFLRALGALSGTLKMAGA